MNEKNKKGTRGVAWISFFLLILLVFHSCKTFMRAHEGNSPETFPENSSFTGEASSGKGDGTVLREDAPAGIHALPTGYALSLSGSLPEPVEEDETVMALKGELSDSLGKVEYLKNVLKENEERANAELAMQRQRIQEKDQEINELKDEVSHFDSENSEQKKKILFLEDSLARIESEKEEIRTILSGKERKLHEKNMELARKIEHLQETLERSSEEWKRKLELMKIEWLREREEAVRAAEKGQKEAVRALQREQKETLAAFEEEKEGMLRDFEKELKDLRALLQRRERELAEAKSRGEHLKGQLEERERMIRVFKENLSESKPSRHAAPPLHAGEANLLKKLERSFNELEIKIREIFKEHRFFKAEIERLKKAIHDLQSPPKKKRPGRTPSEPLKREEEEDLLMAL